MSQFYTTPPARGSSAAAGGAESGDAHSEYTQSAAAPAPREGLPPCQRLAVFENRVASLLDRAASCDGKHGGDTRFWVVAGIDGGAGSLRVHPEYRAGSRTIHGAVVELATDDPAEAEAAWERAERWVRTGALD